MDDTAMITVSHLSKTFNDSSGQLAVIRDSSFTIKRGEMTSLLGVSGAGKTTLLQLLGGLDRPTAGTVEIDGRDPSKMRPRELAAFRNLAIGFVFQFHHLMPDFTALENVIIPGLIAKKSRAWCRERSLALLDQVGLAARAGHYPSELSGGERQRVALARAMCNQPDIILADEPTGNLDTENSRMLLELLHKANLQSGQTFLVATHNQTFARGMHRTLWIEDGKVGKKEGRDN